MVLSKDEIKGRFNPNTSAPAKGLDWFERTHGDMKVRNAFESFAHWVNASLPEGRPKSIVLTELETAAMWAHKALAEKAPLAEDG